jgi:hypothetical protein
VILDSDHRSDGRYLELSATSCPEGAPTRPARGVVDIEFHSFELFSG